MVWTRPAAVRDDRPGTLWIDDLHVVGETAPKAVRLNAQRTLLAAPYRPIASSTTPSSHACPARTGLVIPASWPASRHRTVGNQRDAVAQDRPRLLPYRLIAGCGKIAPTGSGARNSRPQPETCLAERERLESGSGSAPSGQETGKERRGRCSSLAAHSASRGSRWRRPFARSPNWSSTSSSWPSSKTASTSVHPRWATIPRPPCNGFARGPSLTPSSIHLDFGPVDWNDPRPAPPVRGPLPVRQDAQRCRADHALRAPGNAPGSGNQAALLAPQSPPCETGWSWPC